ncbi:MAG TPA: aldo/keto reductase [Terriglobales bacterium]|nr:aldo/keto reductase [Terriglobales bacterium]
MTNPRKTLDRREFFTKALAGAGAAVALGRLGRAGGLRAQAAAAASAGGPLITRPLGKTGCILPVVNMGVMNADNPELVRRAYELGVRHFDTAAGYQRGRNEEMVGRVLDELKARDKAVIATKVALPPPMRASASAADLKAAFIRIFEGSLRRLRTDYVDMLYIHDVSRVEDLTRAGFTEALAELKSQKKVRFAGFSTHENMGPCLDEAVRGGFYEVVLVAFNYALADDAALRRSLENAAAKGLGLIAMKTQCTQSWYKEMVPPETQAFYGGSVHQTAVLKWVLQHKFIHTAVPGCTTFSQLEEDMSVARDVAFTPEEKRFLADRKVKLAMAACVRCGACLGTCPAGVDTRALMMAHSYLRYPNVFQAKETLEGVPAGRGLDRCASCDSCRAKCRGRVDIGRRVDQLKLHFA